MRIALVLVAASMLAAPIAAAQNDGPDSEGGRYILRGVDDGVLRVDRETGDTSICREDDIGWACRAVPDDREALEQEIVRLSEENAALARRVGRLEDRLAETPGDAAPADETEGESEGDLPSELELDRMMDTFESMMRRFIEMMRSLREDYGDGG